MLRRSTTTRTASAVLAAGLGLALVAAWHLPAQRPAARPRRLLGLRRCAQGVRSLRGRRRCEPDHAGHPALSPAILPQTNVDLARSTANAESDADSTPTRPARSAPAPSPAPPATPAARRPVAIQTNQASAPASEANEDVAHPARPLAAARPAGHPHHGAGQLGQRHRVRRRRHAALLRRPGAGRPHAARRSRCPAAVGRRARHRRRRRRRRHRGRHLPRVDPRPGTTPAPCRPGSRTDVTSANVLNGLAGDIGSAIQVDVVQTPNYIVSASGLPGGATVTGAGSGRRGHHRRPDARSPSTAGNQTRSTPRSPTSCSATCSTSPAYRPPRRPARPTSASGR